MFSTRSQAGEEECLKEQLDSQRTESCIHNPRCLFTTFHSHFPSFAPAMLSFYRVWSLLFPLLHFSFHLIRCKKFLICFHSISFLTPVTSFPSQLLIPSASKPFLLPDYSLTSHSPQALSPDNTDMFECLPSLKDEIISSYHPRLHLIY